MNSSWSSPSTDQPPATACQGRPAIQGSMLPTPTKVRSAARASASVTPAYSCGSAEHLIQIHHMVEALCQVWVASRPSIGRRTAPIRVAPGGVGAAV